MNFNIFFPTLFFYTFYFILERDYSFYFETENYFLFIYLLFKNKYSLFIHINIQVFVNLEEEIKTNLIIN